MGSGVEKGEARPLWGVVGHAVAAGIAQNYLSKASLQLALYLLPNASGQLPSVASWADVVLHSDPAYAWTAPLHYINTADWQCYYSPQLDCPKNMCVAGAILNYTNRLASLPSSDYNEKVVALKFIVHFLGDIHQPLHVGFASNKDGNTITGTYLTKKSVNLHSVWDTYMITTRIDQDFHGNDIEYQTYLINKINTVWAKDVADWKMCPGSTTKENSRKEKKNKRNRK